MISLMSLSVSMGSRYQTTGSICRGWILVLVSMIGLHKNVFRVHYKYMSQDNNALEISIVMVAPLFGQETPFRSIASAIEFIEEGDFNNEPFRSIQVRVVYDGKNWSEAEFNVKEHAITFLKNREAGIL